MDKKDLIFLVCLVAVLTICIGLGFLHFTANFGLGSLNP